MNKKRIIKKLSKKNHSAISAEIMNFLSTGKSKYFKNEVNEQNVDAIMSIFDIAENEHLKQNLRDAVYLCFIQNNFFKLTSDITMDLLILADEMKVVRVKDFLLRLLFCDENVYRTVTKEKEIKMKILGILSRLDLHANEFKNILDIFIIEPFYISNCLRLSSTYFSTLDFFCEFFFKSIELYKNYPNLIILSPN